MTPVTRHIDLDDHQRLDHELRQVAPVSAEERLRAIIEAEPECVKLLDKDGRLLSMNPAGLAMIEAESFTQVAGMDVRALIAPEDRAAFDTLHSGVFSGTGGTLEFDLIGLRGTRRRLETHAVPLRSAAGEITAHLAVTRDVTERRRAQAAAQAAAERLHMVIEQTPAVLWSTDRELRVTSSLGGGLRALLIAQNGGLGRSVFDVLGTKDAAHPAVGAHLRALAGASVSYEVVFGGRTFNSHVEPLRGPDGTIQGVVGVGLDITERKRAEDALARSGAQLRRLAARLEAIREEERTRIARDIHDQLGQTLTALKMDLVWLRKKLPTKTKDLARKIAGMAAIIDSTVEATQRLVTELRPAVLDDLGLTAAIHWLAEEFRTHTEIPCTVRLPPAELVVGRNQAAALFRILQETLTNVARHAGARHLDIALHILDGTLELVVTDDGQGITPQEIDDPRALGILGIRERALSWGGEVLIHGVPGRGTTVRLLMPIHP